MRPIFVCADALLWTLMSAADGGSTRATFVVETPKLRTRIGRQGARVITGDLEGEGVYRRAFKSGLEPVLIAVPAGRRGRVVAAVRRVAPQAPLISLSEERPPAVGLPGVTSLPLASIAERVIEPALERAVVLGRARELRAHFKDAERVLILLQDDPDPDAIASALALRVLLGRTKAATPIATFGAITRPENRTMTRILEIEVETITPAAVAEYDRVAMVDAQPSFFEETLPEIDLVIDHHPEDAPVRARIKDVRPSYGATSTILWEYLRAVDAKFTPRLATALFYGIKADTQYLERGTVRADMEAFTFLHAHANHGALRRIERPELPDAALDGLAAAIGRRRLLEGVVFVHAGAIAYPELVAQFADFFLQAQGAEWSVVSGTADATLYVSVRNVGYVRAAGPVVRRAFGDLGGAGGHRTMARAVIPLSEWRARVGAATDEAIPDAIAARFLRALEA
jgi:nanoRNase/pAp phosphatase (c-di-AMP/oligoRNAs hydrolase)